MGELVDVVLKDSIGLTGKGTELGFEEGDVI